MADIPFSWHIDLETSKIRPSNGAENDSVLPYELPIAIIKVSKFNLGVVRDTAWTLQFENAKIDKRFFNGQTEKVALLLRRDCGEGKVQINGMVELYDLTFYKRLAKTPFEHELEDGQQVTCVVLDLSMIELSKAVFENTKLCIQGNLSILTNSLTDHQEACIFPEPSSVETNVLKSNHPLVELSYDLSSLFEQRAFFDLIVKCDDTVFYAHRSILYATVPFLKTMLQHPEFNNHIEIVDFKPNVVKKMLFYVYSGRVEDLDFKLGCDLLYAADGHQLPGLITICEEYLKSELNASNAIKLLVLLNSHHDGLKNYVIDFISARFCYFQNTKEWKSLKNNNETLAIIVLEHTVKYLNHKRSNVFDESVSQTFESFSN